MTNHLKEIKNEFGQRFGNWFKDALNENLDSGLKTYLWNWIEVKISQALTQAVKEERERIMDLSYEAMSDKDWTVDNHLRVCSFINRLNNLKNE